MHTIPGTEEWCPRGLMLNALDCGIVSSNSGRALMFTFGKGINPFILSYWVNSNINILLEGKVWL